MQEELKILDYTALKTASSNYNKNKQERGNKEKKSIKQKIEKKFQKINGAKIGSLKRLIKNYKPQEIPI